LEAINPTFPDLILLDLIMPEMDGFAGLEAMQARAETRNIPVVIITARPSVCWRSSAKPG